MGTIGKYRALVARLERRAVEAPTLYRIQLALLAALGIGVLGMTIALALGLSVGLVVFLAAANLILLVKLIKVIWIPMALAWVVLKALWIRFERPGGHVLQPGEAPALQAEVERLRLAAGAPKLAGIILDDRLNAAAASIPRMLGLLGHTHWLVLGLPLMERLDRDQFAAVVAHEFGHFGGRHGHFTGWIYRVRVSWYAVLEALERQRSTVARMYARFFEWYAPYFNAYSYVLARQQEYAADAMAARIVGAQAVGGALVRIDTGAQMQDAFFADLNRAVYDTEDAPADASYQRLAERLRTSDEGDVARVRAALSREASADDTHPSLLQRLAALGLEDVHADPSPTSAAQALLGDLLPVLETRYAEAWSDSIAQHWQQLRAAVVQDRARLAELEAKERDIDEDYERARLVAALRTQDEGITLYREVLERAPHHVPTQICLGMLLAERLDPACVAHVRLAMKLDASVRELGLATLDVYLRESGASDEARDALAREIRAQRKHDAKLDEARNTFSRGNRFLPHDLEPQVLDALREALTAIPNVKKAWLARKDLGDPTLMPHYALLVAWRGMMLSEEKTLQRIAETVELPGSFVAFTAPHQRGIARKVKKAGGDAVYHRR